MSTNITNASPSDWLPDSQASDIKPVARLYFQVAASAVAWLSLGLADLLITWRTCIGQEQFGAAGANTISHALYFSVTGLLLCLAALAGTMSYRSWKKLSGLTGLLRAEGRERSEFMSLAGLYISFTLGAGMVWLGFPLFILGTCVRTR